MLKFYYVRLQCEFLRGPLDWGFRLLGKAPKIWCGRSWASIRRGRRGINTSGEVEIGSTYPDPPDAIITRIRGVFNFALPRMADAEKGQSFCCRVPASSQDGD